MRKTLIATTVITALAITALYVALPTVNDLTLLITHHHADQSNR